MNRPSTHDFEETVDESLPREPEFRRALLREAIECFMAGDVDTGKAVLRDYINGTIRFQELSDLTHAAATSLMRMFGPNGSPQARNLFDIIAQLQRAEGLHLEVSLKR